MTEKPAIERRRDRRYKVQFPATISTGIEAWPITIDDVSYRGLFLRTEARPVLRQLLEVRFELSHPRTDELFHLKGMSRWQQGGPAGADDTEGADPGQGSEVGIEFVDLSDEIVLVEPDDPRLA